MRLAQTGSILNNRTVESCGPKKGAAEEKGNRIYGKSEKQGDRIQNADGKGNRKTFV